MNTYRVVAYNNKEVIKEGERLIDVVNVEVQSASEDGAISKAEKMIDRNYYQVIDVIENSVIYTTKPKVGSEEILDALTKFNYEFMREFKAYHKDITQLSSKSNVLQERIAVAAESNF